MPKYKGTRKLNTYVAPRKVALDVKKLKKDVRKIKKVTELRGKTVAISYSGTGTLSTSDAYQLNKIAGGDLGYERQGNNCVLHSMRIKARLYPSGTSPIPKYFRITILKDKNQNIGLAPNYIDFWGLTDATDVEIPNFVNSDRFIVLYDKIHYVQLNSTSQPRDYPHMKQLDFYVKNIKGLECEYTNNTDTNIKNNGIWMYVHSGQGIASGETVAINGQCMMKFKG